MYNRGMGIPRQQTPIGGGLREMGGGGKVKRYRCMCSNADGVSIECGYYRRPTAKKCSQCCADRGYSMQGFTEVYIDGSDPTAMTQKRASGNTGGELGGGTLREGGEDFSQRCLAIVMTGKGIRGFAITSGLTFSRGSVNNAVKGLTAFRNSPLHQMTLQS